MSSFFTPSQIRAACGLIGWTASSLADRVGVSKQMISSYLSGKSGLSANNLEKIAYHFDMEGVEFTPDEGVKRKTLKTKTYRGQAGFKSFMDDVYEQAKEHGGKIYLFNSRPRLWHEWLGEEWYEMHSQRMKKLGDSIDVKIIVEKGDDFLILKTAQHKQFPKGLYQNKIFYAYGHKLAFLNFEENNLIITVLEQKEFTGIFCALYEIAWEKVAINI